MTIYFVVNFGLFPDIEANVVLDDIASDYLAIFWKRLGDGQCRVAGKSADLDASLGANSLQNELKVLNHIQ